MTKIPKIKKAEPLKDPKDHDFNKILQEIRQEFDNEGVMFLDQSPDSLEDIHTVSTGSLAIDKALGCGGLPYGRIIEIFGPEQSGKTTLALHALASAQRDDGFLCGYIDMEHAMDPRYAEKIGVIKDKLFFAQPTGGERALDLAQKMVEVGLKFIVIDSVSALVPKAELEGAMEGGQPASQARMMSKFLRRLVPETHRKKAIILFVNQLRHKVGVTWGSPETTSGGQALKYYSSIRIDVRSNKKIKDKEVIIGTHSVAKIVKNKLAPPQTRAEFQITYGKGISKTGETIDLGVEYDLIQRSGAWYSIIEDGESIQIGQGSEQTKAWLEQNPEKMNQIRQQISQKMFFKDKEA